MSPAGHKMELSQHETFMVGHATSFMVYKHILFEMFEFIEQFYAKCYLKITNPLIKAF